MGMKKLTVVAPADKVQVLKALALDCRMSQYTDGAYLKLKWGLCKEVLDLAPQILPEGSYQIYASAVGLRKHASRAGVIDAVRIRIK